jgi:transposase
MSTPRKYPPELRDRAVRLVLEAQKADEQLTLNAAAVRIATRVG